MENFLKGLIFKTTGRSRLTFAELRTTAAETELFINTRPLAYVASTDGERSHILNSVQLLLRRRPGPIYEDIPLKAELPIRI